MAVGGFDTDQSARVREGFTPQISAARRGLRHKFARTPNACSAFTIPTASIPPLMTKRSYFIASSPVASRDAQTRPLRLARDRTDGFYHSPPQGRAAHGAGGPTHRRPNILIQASAARK